MPRVSLENDPLDLIESYLVIAAIVVLKSRHETKESIIVDRLMRSTEALRARKQAIFVEMEEALFATVVFS